MKKAAILIVTLVFLLVGCTSSNNKSSDKNIKNLQEVKKTQKYSFGPMADLSKIDDKTKQTLQQSLNEFGNIIKDEITFNPIDVSYTKDGNIFVDLFIRNGHSYSIFNIDTNLQIINDGKVVASAPFSFKEDEFGRLNSNDSRPWTILFYPEDIKLKNIKLDKITIKSSGIQYEF